MDDHLFVSFPWSTQNNNIVREHDEQSCSSEKMNKVETVSENKKSDRNLGHNIYVAGLSTRTEEADLEELFHPFGEVMIILFRIY